MLLVDVRNMFVSKAGLRRSRKWMDIRELSSMSLLLYFVCCTIVTFGLLTLGRVSDGQ